MSIAPPTLMDGAGDLLLFNGIIESLKRFLSSSQFD